MEREQSTRSQIRQDAPGPVRARLEAHGREIRSGLGVHKSPAQYGAIPTDPYSHTPSFAGAQQPGMTGQVKEDFLSRFAELGLRVREGRILFLPWMVNRDEFLRETARFDYVDAAGQFLTLDLPASTLAFTFCQVPVVLHEDGWPRILASRTDGSRLEQAGLELDPQTSREIFQRSGGIQRLDVFLGLGV